MSDEMREAFEKWYAQKYLGVNVGDAFEYLPSHGYKRLDVHFPWLGYQAATAAADAKYLPVIEKLVDEGKHAAECLHNIMKNKDWGPIEEIYCGLDEALAQAAELLGRK